MVSEEAARRALESAGVPSVISKLNISKTFANSELLTKVFTQPTSLLMAATQLGPRLRELIILRVAWLNRCEYEWVQHYGFSKAIGLSDDDIAGVKAWERHPGFDQSDRAVLELTDALAGGEAVSEELWRRLVDSLGGEIQAVEAAAIAGAWTLVAYMIKTADVPIEEGQPSWPPDGSAPGPKP